MLYFAFILSSLFVLTLVDSSSLISIFAWFKSPSAFKVNFFGSTMKATLSPPRFSHFIDDWHLSPVLDTGDSPRGCTKLLLRADALLARRDRTGFKEVFRESIVAGLKLGVRVLDGRYPMADLDAAERNQVLDDR